MHRPALIVVAALVPAVAHADPQPTTPKCECPSPTVVIDKGASARRNAKLVAVGGAALWVASVVWAKRIQDDFNNDVRVEPLLSKDEAKDQMRYASGVFLGGVAALGVAAYLYFGKGREREVKTIVAPVVTQDRVGFALDRRF